MSGCCSLLLCGQHLGNKLDETALLALLAPGSEGMGAGSVA
jgi:hypothetical protein